MSYDTLKEAPWLVSQEVEDKTRETAEKTGLTPGEVFRQAALKGMRDLQQ